MASALCIYLQALAFWYVQKNYEFFTKLLTNYLNGVKMRWYLRKWGFYAYFQEC